MEVDALMAVQGSILHYVKDFDDTLRGRITANLGDMGGYLRERYCQEAKDIDGCGRLDLPD